MLIMAVYLLNADAILKLLKEEKVYSKQASGVKSSVWNHFSLLYFSQDYSNSPEQYTGYVLCKHCKKSLKHDRMTSGTTHLHEHFKISCEKKPNKQKHQQPSISSFLKSDPKLSQSDQKKLINASVQYISKNLSCTISSMLCNFCVKLPAG